MGADEVFEMRAADLLLAFDEDADVARQPPRLLHVRFDSLEVHEHLALVVGRPAGVELAVAHRGLERRRRPQLQRIDRLHVVMAVEEDRGRPRRAQPVGVHHRVAGRFDEARVLHPDSLELVLRPLGAAADVGRVLGQCADARDGQVRLQLLDVVIAIEVDEIDDGRRRHDDQSGWMRWRLRVTAPAGSTIRLCHRPGVSIGRSWRSPHSFHDPR